jgi:hypothetical protein
MMRILAVLLLFSGSALAAPFLVSDPLGDQSTTHCGYVVDGAAKAEIPVGTNATGQKICKIDLAAITTGTHTAVVTAIKTDPVWGRQESAPAPNFTFARPSAPTAPAGMAITP